MKSARGFTLYELATVLAILPVVAGAIMHFSLEGRIATTAIEVRVDLRRAASLVIEQVSRDLRSSHGVRFDPATIHLEGPGRSIRWHADDSGISRIDCSDDSDCSEHRLHAHIDQIAIEPAPGGYLVRVHGSRPLTRRRSVELVREAFVGSRR